MKQEPYEFSKLWDRIAQILHLSSEPGGPGGQRRDAGAGQGGSPRGPQGPPPGNVRPLRPQKPRKKRRWWLIILIAVIVLFVIILLARGIYLYTEWLWFGEMGYTSVFWKSLLSKLGLGFAAAVIFYAFIYGNIMLARRMSPRFQFGPGTEIIERVPLPDAVVRVIIPVALLLPALIVFAASSTGWLDLLKFLNRAPFGVSDPVFDHDAGFYVFALPFMKGIETFAWWTLILTLLATAAVHFLDYAINWENNHVTFAPHVKAHLSVLAGLIMFLLGYTFLLRGYTLMFSPRGVVFGASYTDVHATLPVYKFLFVVSLIAGALFLANIYFRGWKLPAAALALIILTSIFGAGVYPVIVQQYQVSPNELAKEQQYIQYNIDFTRHAFDLENIDEKPFAADNSLTPQQVQANAATINNIRLWRPDVLGQTYNQIQVIRPYYTFPDVDVDRYMIAGKESQVMLSGRELNVNNLPAPAQTWQNQQLVYTHGYGLVMSPVAQATAEGLPFLYIQDIPPVNSQPELQVTNPAIYYGETGNDYVVVDTTTQEFDYPQGDQNVYTTYAGAGGVDIGSFWRRAAFSWRFASLKLLVSGSVQDGSRIMIHRQLHDRIMNIAPFLQYDSDPYPVLAQGRIFWIQDAYTTTENYPYSQPSSKGYNYIRNSVKVVMDAYNGDVKFYVVDPSDPMIQTYRNIFPDLFVDASQMPAELVPHLRYPEDMFSVQNAMYATYHMTDPQVFYNKEDQWQIPTLNGAPMAPYYVIMALPGETQEQFLLLQPMNPNTKDNMIALMAAKMDPGVYGERTVFKFPKEKVVFGPQQISARFNQDPAISQQITLWNQSGSRVIFGDLLVIPIEQSIIYVQPVYLRAEQGQIPELKRVMVSYGDPNSSKVTMQNDLATALQVIFNTSVAAPTAPAPPGTTTAPTTPAPAPSANINDLVNSAVQHYNNAVNAQKNGDWATYGNELKALQDTLTQLQAVSGVSGGAPPAAGTSTTGP